MYCEYNKVSERIVQLSYTDNKSFLLLDEKKNLLFKYIIKYLKKDNMDL